MADSLASRLSQLRSYAGISARALGDRAGLAETHVSAIENGSIKSPTVATAQKLADALGAPLSWLLLGEGRPPSEAAVQRAVKASSPSAA